MIVREPSSVSTPLKCFTWEVGGTGLVLCGYEGGQQRGSYGGDLLDSWKDVPKQGTEKMMSMQLWVIKKKKVHR